MPKAYVVFTSGGAELGVPVQRVGGVLPMKELTPIRRAPSYLRGMIKMGEQRVPVIDLAVKFGLPVGHYTPRTCIVMVQVLSADQPVLVGLLTPEIPMVLNIGPEQIRAAAVGSQMESCAWGEAEIEGHVKTLLDLDKTVSIPELFPANEFVN
jgi:purine-binding chemotaxis protein CheW